METYVSLKAQEFVSQFLNNQNAILLDVRTNSEYKKEHILGATLAPGIETIINDFDKGKPYYLHCRVGGRCAIVAYKMVSAGFKKVYNLNDNLDNLVSEFEKTNTHDFTLIKAA